MPAEPEGGCLAATTMHRLVAANSVKVGISPGVVDNILKSEMFSVLLHETNLGESSSVCKLVLHSDWFIECAARFEMTYRLANLFIALSNKLHLDLVQSLDKDTALCCEAGLKTRAILFGSCHLQVVQTIRVQGSMATFTLHWNHPMPEESAQEYAHITKGMQKRANFVKLLNNLWEKQLKSEITSLGRDFQLGKDITSFSIQGHLPVVQRKTHAEQTKIMESDSDVESQIQKLLMRTHISKTLKTCSSDIVSKGYPLNSCTITSTTTTTTTNNTTQAEIGGSSPSQNELIRKQRSKSMCARKPSSLKKSLAKQSKSQSEFQRVVFSNHNSIHELSLSKESREARMGPEGSAVDSYGKPKPLVNVKTGAFVWPTVTTETRKVIAPFNFSEDGDDLKLPENETETETEQEPEPKTNEELLPLKKRPFLSKRKSENMQENQKAGINFPLLSQITSTIVGNSYKTKPKRKVVLKRSSSSKRLRRHDTSVSHKDVKAEPTVDAPKAVST